MSASTDPAHSPSRQASPPATMSARLRAEAAWLWSPVCLLYLALCLAGLACGLWADEVIPPKTANRPLPLHTLSTLTMSQMVFFLLVYPVAILRRGERRRERPGERPAQESLAIQQGGRDNGLFWAWRFLPQALFLLLVVTVPFYVIATYLADATLLDCLRGALAVLLVLPLCLAICSWLRLGGVWRTMGGAMMMLLAMGLPAAWYIAAEIVKASWSEVLWDLGPVTLAWNNGQDRLGLLLPRPVWAWGLWQGVAAAMLLVSYLVSLLRGSSETK